MVCSGRRAHDSTEHIERTHAAPPSLRGHGRYDESESGNVLNETAATHDSPGRLMIMCGTSPMPILLAIDTFPAHDIVLVHGPDTGRETAERVTSSRPDRAYLLVEVSLDDPARVNEQISTSRTSSGELITANRTLVYGGGTTPMNVLAYANWITTNGPETRAWYLASAAGEFRGDDGSTRKPNSSLVDVEQIAPLHSRGEATISSGVDLLTLARRLTDEEIDSIGKVVRTILTTTDNQQRVAALQQRTPQWLREKLGLANIQDDNTNAPGDFMEFVLAVVLCRFFGKELDEIRGNVKRVEQGRYVWEVDLVLRARERVMVVSSGISAGQMRQKFLELDTRCAQVGGSEAFGLTVGRIGDTEGRSLRDIVAATNRLRSDLMNGGQPGRFNAVDFSELFHQDTVSVLRNPAELLRQGQRSHIGAWLDSWMNGPPAE